MQRMNGHLESLQRICNLLNTSTCVVFFFLCLRCAISLQPCHKLWITFKMVSINADYIMRNIFCRFSVSEFFRTVCINFIQYREEKWFFFLFQVIFFSFLSPSNFNFATVRHNTTPLKINLILWWESGADKKRTIRYVYRRLYQKTILQLDKWNIQL